MKRFVVVAVVVAVLAMTLAGTALAQGYGPGAGIHAPGTGLANGTPAPGTGQASGPAYRAGMGRWADPQNGQPAPMGGMMRRGAPAGAGLPDEVATLLGMSQEEIQAERQAGKSLAQIAGAKGVSEQKLSETILNVRQAELKARVAAGTLTQEQADVCIAQMQSQVSAMIDRTTVGPNPNRGTGPLAGQGMRGRWSR